MNISIWILFDWLKKYEPQQDIYNGNRTISGVRLLNHNISLEDQFVYVGKDELSGHIVCINGNDRLLLNTVDLNTVFNEILSAFDFYNSWNKKLRIALWNIESEEDLLRMSGEIFPGQILVLSDTSYCSHAVYSLDIEKTNEPLASRLEHDKVLDIISILDVEKVKCVRINNRSSFRLSVSDNTIKGSLRNLFLKDYQLGWLVIINMTNEQTNGQLDLQDELGDLVEEWFQLHPDNREVWTQSGLFLDLLDENYPSKESIQLRLQLLNWELDHPKLIYAIHPREDAPSNDIIIRKVNQLSKGGHCFAYQEEIIVIFNMAFSKNTFFEKEIKELLQLTHCRCGKSPVFNNMMQMKTHLQFARAALDFGDNETIINEFNEHALSYGLSFIPKETCNWIIHPAIHVLKEYDKVNGTQMSYTLKTYLNNNCNYTRTYEILKLHRSTLLYRLERIKELTGISLDNSQTRLHLLVSFEIL